MNWLDYLLIVILALSVLRSFSRGLTRELISLAAAIAALILGMWFYGMAGLMVRRWFGSDRTADFIGFVMVFAAVILLGALVGSIVRRFVKAVGLSFFDRFLGAGFGLVRGALIAIALLMAYIAFGPRNDSKTAPDAVIHSQIAPFLLKASSIFVAAAPMELKQNFHEVYDAAQLKIHNIARSGMRAVTNENAGKK